MNNNWDINVIEKNYWLQQLSDNIVYNSVASLSIPPESPCILKNPEFPFPFKINFMKLKNHVDHFQGKHQEIAMKLFKRGNFMKGRKILVHPLRCITFALQILETGKVYDFLAANIYTQQIKEMDCKKWTDVENWYYENLYFLDTKFRHHVNTYKLTTPLITQPESLTSHYISETSTWKPPPEPEIFPYWVIPENDPPSIYVIPHVRKFGFQNMFRDMSINVHPLSKKFPNLLQFDCDTTLAPRASKIVEQCQGLVLDADNDYQAVCYPFDRFHPHDGAEEHMPKIDWSKAKYSEKINGLGISLFWYSDQWLISIVNNKNVLTRNILPPLYGPDPELDTYDTTYQKISTYFWNTWNSKKMNIPFHKHNTYMFVYVPPLVTNIERLVLVGVRNLISLKEENHVPHAITHGWDYTEQLNFHEISSARDPATCFPIMLSECQKLSILRSEGYVVVSCEGLWPRVTFKSKIYENLENMTEYTTLSNKIRVFLSVVGCEGNLFCADEFFCALFCKWKRWYMFVSEKMFKFCKEVDSIYQQIKHIDNQKEFAIEVKKMTKDINYSSCLFQLKNNGTSNLTMKDIWSVDAKTNIIKWGKTAERILFSEELAYAKERQLNEPK